MPTPPGPLVTIVIPVFNGENFLAEAIDSALAQTYERVEVLVVDDGSTDGGATERVARSYGDRITYLHQPNGGTASALNLGIARMRGEYFSWLSHDDRHAPDKVLRQVERLAAAGGGPAVVFGNFRNMDERLERVIQLSGFDARLERSARCAMLQFSMNGCALLVPRGALEAAGGFDPAQVTTHDYDLWLRLAGAGVPFLFVPDTLVDSRVHPAQDSNRKRELLAVEADAVFARIAAALTADELRRFSDDPAGFLDGVFAQLVVNGWRRAAAAVLRAGLTLLDRPGEREAVEARLLGGRLGLARPAEARAALLRLAASPRRRVLHVNGWWGVGGAERVVANLAGSGADRHDAVLVNYEDQAERIGYPVAPSVTRLDLRPGPRWFDAVEPLAAALAADLAIIYPNFLPGLTPLYQALARLRVRTVCVQLNAFWLPAVYPDLHGLLAAREEVWRAADAVVWITRASAALCASRHDRTFLLRPPVDVRPDPGPRPRGSAPRLLAVGRFDDALKRVDLLVAAFGRLLERHPAARLTLLGPHALGLRRAPERPSLEEALAALGPARGQVELVGTAPSVEVHYLGADLLLHASETEGCPLVFVEAGQHRLPVVAMEFLDVAGVLVDGENGRVVPAGDVDALAAAAADLLDDDARRLAMGARGRELALRFDPARVTGDWGRLFDAVLERGREARGAAADLHVADGRLESEDVARVVRDSARALQRLFDERRWLAERVAALEARVEVAAARPPEAPPAAPPPFEVRTVGDAARATALSLRADGVAVTARRVAAALWRAARRA